ncbi:hypothetical protein GF352_00330 [archaeon]|nr:hypothetical protein [archaeon]
MNLKLVFRKVWSNDIARRSFTKNGFDGVLTVIGVLIALFLSGVTTPKIIVFSCIGSGIAMCVSGLWGAYVTESAERRIRVMKLEKHLLRGLKGTSITGRSQEASLIVALVDGLTPLILTIILIIPFFLTPFISLETAYYSSLGASALIIIFLGVIIARLSKTSLLVNVIKMLVAGVTVVLLMYFIELLKFI